MLIVRDVFEISVNHLEAAEQAIKALGPAGAQAGLGRGRVLRDRSDEYDAKATAVGRLVVEREFATMESFVERTSSARVNQRWLAAWTACKPFVRRAWREVLHTIE